MDIKMYKSTIEETRSNLINKLSFPHLKSLLEANPVNYKSKLTDKIVTALIQSNNLSRYTLVSVFDDRILVTDPSGAFYHIPFSIEKDVLTFSVPVAAELSQTESTLVKSELLKEISMMIESYTTNKEVLNTDKIVMLALEKLRLDGVSESLKKTIYDECFPVIRNNASALIENWKGYSKEFKNKKLVENANTLTEAYQIVVQFRNFLQEKGYAKYGHYIDGRAFDGYLQEFKEEVKTDLTERERATLVNFFKNRVKFIEEGKLLVENDEVGMVNSPESQGQDVPKSETDDEEGSLQVGDKINLKFGDITKSGYKIDGFSQDKTLVYVTKNDTPEPAPYHFSQVEKLQEVQAPVTYTYILNRADILGQDLNPSEYTPNSTSTSPLANYQKILTDAQHYLRVALEGQLPDDLKAAISDILDRVNS